MVISDGNHGTSSLIRAGRASRIQLLIIGCTRKLAGMLLACLFGTVPHPVIAGDLPDDLTSMSLEALMDLEVTSVSKKPEKQSGAAAAIFVITNEDLRRWGVTNIPDALRRVPGISVARIDANKWAITARGFNSRFANKLLVLIDGRSVYTPLFAGVYWETQNLVLEDVDRIEVIRGPGGTLWGANAVNGVINIITRSAAETRGDLVTVAAGNEVSGSGSVRHGDRLENGGDYRVYAKHESYDEGYNPAGAQDDWHSSQAGFRADWDAGPGDAVTLQGDVYKGAAGQLVTIPSGEGPTTGVPVAADTDTGGGNVLLRWSRDLETDNNLALQVYYDHVGLDGPVLFEDRDTFDIDFQHRFHWKGMHDFVWGLGYRFVHDDTDNNANFSLDPSARDVNLINAFLQDEITLAEDLRLTLGSKLEYNDFSNFDIQPNARIAWSLDEGQTLWGAVSRAVRTPARGEHDVLLRLLPEPDPGVPVYAAGSRHYDPETVLAWETGYRYNHNSRWSVDIAAFYNDYGQLRTLEPVTTPSGDILFSFENNMSGNTRGLELAGNWQVLPGWRLNATYTWMLMDLQLRNGSMDYVSRATEDATPTSSAALWSAHDIGNNLQFDAAVRYVNSIVMDATRIDGYLELDLRLAWEAKPGLEFSLIGQNLLDDRHREFLPDFIDTQPTELERSIYGRVIWHL